MKKYFFLLLILCLFGCQSEEDKIRETIYQSNSLVIFEKKIGDIEKIDEDLFYRKVIFNPWGGFIDKGVIDKDILNTEHSYAMTRYIYKTSEGVYRMFYLIDIDGEEVTLKSSDPNDFFIPLNDYYYSQFHDLDLIGDQKMQMMR